MSSAIVYLHWNGIIYRDLKAENVLVWNLPAPHSRDSCVKVKLADYGISVTAMPSGTKGYGGTPGFMAPEIVQYDGKEKYTEKVGEKLMGVNSFIHLKHSAMIRKSELQKQGVE